MTSARRSLSSELMSSSGQSPFSGTKHSLIPALLTVLVVLPTITEAKFRQRSALDALAGSIDIQIVFELVAWTLGVVYVLIALRREISELRPPSFAGGKYLIAVAALITIGTAWATPSALAVTRGLQTTVILVVVVSVLPMPGRTIQDLVTKGATWLSAVVAGLFFLTIALPGSSLFTEPSYFGIQRLKFLEIHPIPAANLLTMTIVLNTWVLLSGAVENSRLSNRLRAAWIFLMMAGLLLTRSRGALVGCVVAVLVLVAAALISNDDHRMRRLVRVCALGLGALTVLFGEQLANFMLRGEGVQSLLTLNSRTDLLESMIQLWQEKFWFGFGHLSGRSALLDRFAWAGESHNLVGEAILSYGLVGLSLVSIGLLGALIRATKLMRRSKFGPLFLALLLVVGSQALVGDGFLGAPGYELSAFVLLVIVGWEGKADRLDARSPRAVFSSWPKS